MQFVVKKFWDGAALAKSEWVTFTLSVCQDQLIIDISAPLLSNSQPPFMSGNTSKQQKLWEYEVAEIFFANDTGEYFEIQLGPYGHYLCLSFKNYRGKSTTVILTKAQSAIKDNQWCGQIMLPVSNLPINCDSLNCYYAANEETHLAALSHTGTKADFHNLSAFVPYLF